MSDETKTETNPAMSEGHPVELSEDDLAGIAGGTPAGRAEVHDIVVPKVVDKATPGLFL